MNKRLIVPAIGLAAVLALAACGAEATPTTALATATPPGAATATIEVAAPPTPQGGQTPDALTDLEAARQVLLAYLEALNTGDYAEAAEYYGGSLDPLTGYNPDVQPDDRATLFERACTANGFQCLKVGQIVREESPQAGHFRFGVEFEKAEGGRYEQPACCGADATAMPARTEWVFNVLKQDSAFLVQDLPPYTP